MTAQQIIKDEITLLQSWIDQSKTGGWSTHLVKPMEDRILQLQKIHFELSSPSSSAGVWVIIPTDLTIKQKAEEYERSYKSTGQPGTCTAFAAGADFVRSLITPQKQ